MNTQVWWIFMSHTKILTTFLKSGVKPLVRLLVFECRSGAALWSVLQSPYRPADIVWNLFRLQCLLAVLGPRARSNQYVVRVFYQREAESIGWAPLWVLASFCLTFREVSVHCKWGKCSQWDIYTVKTHPLEWKGKWHQRDYILLVL